MYTVEYSLELPTSVCGCVCVHVCLCGEYGLELPTCVCEWRICSGIAYVCVCGENGLELSMCVCVCVQ